MKKSNFKTNRTKLYHKLINNKLMYDNKSVNRYKKDINKNLMVNIKDKDKVNLLEKLRSKINSIKNCELKKMQQT